MRKSDNISFETETQLWREFWIYKYGYFPTTITKVARKVTFEEDNKERGALDKEFQDFVNSRKDL